MVEAPRISWDVEFFSSLATSYRDDYYIPNLSFFLSCNLQDSSGWIPKLLVKILHTHDNLCCCCYFTSTLYALKEEKIEKLSPNRDDTNLDV